RVLAEHRVQSQEFILSQSCDILFATTVLFIFFILQRKPYHMPEYTEQFDTIIIGAGHNGLVAAGYLARAGKKVLVLESRDRVGGACTLEEPFPGFTMSPCAYVVSLLRPEIIRDLELHRYGFDAYVKDPQMFVPYPDGNYLFLRASTQKTVEGIRRLSPHDAEAYPRFLRFFERASEILNPILLEEPPSVADL